VGQSLPAVWALQVNPERRQLTQVPAVPAGLALPLNRMPERVDENSDTKNARDDVEKKGHPIGHDPIADSLPASFGKKK